MYLQDLEFDGPLAPNHASTETCEDAGKRPLFAEFSDGPIAAASLGQVYKARTWDGVDVDQGSEASRDAASRSGLDVLVLVPQCVEARVGEQGELGGDRR